MNNPYRKIVIVIAAVILICICANSYGQSYNQTFTGQTTQVNTWRGGESMDSFFRIPFVKAKVSNLDSCGRLYLDKFSTHIFYVNNCTGWQQVFTMADTALLRSILGISSGLTWGDTSSKLATQYQLDTTANGLTNRLAPGSGSANYIQNQNTGIQSPGYFDIDAQAIAGSYSLQGNLWTVDVAGNESAASYSNTDGTFASDSYGNTVAASIFIPSTNIVAFVDTNTIGMNTISNRSLEIINASDEDDYYPLYSPSIMITDSTGNATIIGLLPGDTLVKQTSASFYNHIGIPLDTGGRLLVNSDTSSLLATKHNIAGLGTGSVTSVSVTTANGVSGTVATSTTTPAITLSLGAITPSSVNASGTVAGSNLSGTNTGDQTISLTGDVTGSGTSSFAATIGANKVTYAKMQSETASTLLGNPTGSGAVPSEITLGTGLAFSGTTLTNTGAPASGSANYIQNQTAVPQTGGWNVTGNTHTGGLDTVSGAAYFASTVIASGNIQTLSGNVNLTNGSLLNIGNFGLKNNNVTGVTFFGGSTTALSTVIGYNFETVLGRLLLGFSGKNSLKAWADTFGNFSVNKDSVNSTLVVAGASTLFTTASSTTADSLLGKTSSGVVVSVSRQYTYSGTATLSSGSVTVSNANIKTGTPIMLTYGLLSGTTGQLYASTIINATSFVISSNLTVAGAPALNTLDNSTVNYSFTISY